MFNQPTREQALALLADPSKIHSVYSGKANRCCCGCAGKHTYREGVDGKKVRGYDLSPEEVNEGTVKRQLKRMVKLLEAGDFDELTLGGTHVGFDCGTRMLVAYF